jgi:hypothetical protein
MAKTKKKSGTTTLIIAGLWLLTYTACLLIIKKWSPESALGIVLALVPVLAFALFIFSLIKSVSSLDEVQVRVQMEATVIAFSLGILMIMTLGLLDLVISLNPEDWSFRHIVPYFAIFYFIGLFISKRKYNFDDEKHD